MGGERMGGEEGGGGGENGGAERGGRWEEAAGGRGRKRDTANKGEEVGAVKRGGNTKALPPCQTVAAPQERAGLEGGPARRPSTPTTTSLEDDAERRAVRTATLHRYLASLVEGEQR